MGRRPWRSGGADGVGDKGGLGRGRGGGGVSGWGRKRRARGGRGGTEEGREKEVRLIYLGFVCLHSKAMTGSQQISIPTGRGEIYQ